MRREQEGKEQKLPFPMSLYSLLAEDVAQVKR